MYDGFMSVCFFKQKTAYEMRISDWSSDVCSSDPNQYATSLVVLDVMTGKPVWNFQTTHKDVWDYDLGSQPTLIDFPTARGNVPAVVLASKQGDRKSTRLNSSH